MLILSLLLACSVYEGQLAKAHPSPKLKAQGFKAVIILIMPNKKFLILHDFRTGPPKPPNKYDRFLNKQVIIKGKVIRGKHLINGEMLIANKIRLRRPQ